MDWIRENSGLMESLRGIAVGNDKFVTVGDHSTIAYSNDGTSWVSVPFEDKRYELNDIIWDGDKFIAVGVCHDDRVDSGVILTSFDGTKWSSEPVDSNYAFYNSIASNEGVTLI